PLGPKPSALPSLATTRKARPRGVEPLACLFLVKRSIQLSYGRICYYGAEGRTRTGTEVNPPQDFKSCASAYSATPAWHAKRKTGFEPATPTLARWYSTAELLPRIFHRYDGPFLSSG